MADATVEITELGDKLAGLTLKQAVDLAGYLKEQHGIEPAAGGVVMAGGGGGRPRGAAPAAGGGAGNPLRPAPQGPGGQKNYTTHKKRAHRSLSSGESV